jgi:hypothetical protein
MMQFYGGPMHGLDVILKPGWPPPDRMTHRDYETLGHYFRGEDGNYHWVDAPLPTLARSVPPA